MRDNKINNEGDTMALQVYSSPDPESVHEPENVAVEDASGEFEANRSAPAFQPDDIDPEDQQRYNEQTRCEDKDEGNKMAMEVHSNPDPEPVCDVEEDTVEEDFSDDENFESTRSSFDSPLDGLDPEEKQSLEPIADEDLPPDDINSAPTLPTKYDDSDEESGPMQEIILHDSPPPAAVPPPAAMEEGRASNISKSKSIWSEAPDTKKSTKHKDRCCHCFGCANGAIQVLFSQFFLVAGLCLCSWAMMDCNFIQAAAGYPEVYVPEPYVYTNVYYSDPYSPAPTASPTTTSEHSNFEVAIYQRRGFGFVFNETKEGECLLYPNSRSYHGDEFLNYMDFLGSDWNIPRILGGVALALGWLLFFGTFLMWCVSCIKAVRLLVGTILILVIGGFQVSTFAVIGSSFCNEEEFTNCEPGRGFWMMQGGIACYLIAAIFFCSMKDFPGRKASR